MKTIAVRCFSDRLMIYAGGQTSHLLKKKEPYTKVRTLYMISVLGGYLKVNGEDAPRRDALLRRAELRKGTASFKAVPLYGR